MVVILYGVGHAKAKALYGVSMIKSPKNNKKIQSWRAYRRWYLRRPNFSDTCLIADTVLKLWCGQINF
jgi:hypothetical protein